MSLDRIGRFVLSPGTNSQVNAGNSAPYHWDDDVGLLAMLYNTAIAGESATPTYHVIQLDGSMTWRNPSVSGISFGIDLSKPNGALRVTTNTVGDMSTHTWSLGELEKRMGTTAFRNGVAQMVATARLMHTIPTTVTGVVASNLRPLFCDKDRIFVVNSVTGGGVTPSYMLGWLPRDPGEPQIITNVLWLSSSGVYRNYTVSRSDNPRRVWLAEGWSVIENCYLKEFDLDTLTVTQNDSIKYDTGTSQWFHGAWWSRKFKAFIALYTNNSNQKAILLCSPERVPATVSSPNYIMPGAVGQNLATVTGISLDNPMKVKISGSVSAWLAATGGSSGARACLLSAETIDDQWGVPWTGYGEALYNLNSPGHLFPIGDQAFGGSIPVTVIDDSTISLDVDGAVARDRQEVGYIDNATDYGHPGKSFMYAYSTDTSVLAACSITFMDFLPVDHPLNGMTVAVAGWDDGTVYDYGCELPFDVATMPPIDYHGKFVVEPGVDGYIPVSSRMKLDSSGLSCNVIAIDRDVHPAVLTVEDPAFLVKLGLTANGQTAPMQIMDHSFYYSPFYGTWTVTRVDTDKITTDRPRKQFMTSAQTDTIEANSNPIIHIYGNYIEVGRKIWFGENMAGMTGLNGLVATITEKIDSSHGRLSIDTTGMGALDHSGFYYPYCYFYEQPHPGMRLVVMKPQGVATPQTVQGTGIKVEAVVQDDQGSPCVNQPVTWSANQEGIFIPEISFTDSIGKAATIFIPSKDYLGNVSVTATAVFP
jgi:hypothetical protein